MGIELKPYQAKILEELEYLPSVALFMGTGSGKTYTSLFKFKENKTPNLLVICPSRVITQWHASIKTVVPEIKVLTFRPTATAKSIDTIIHETPANGIAVVVSLNSVWKMQHLLTKVDASWTVIVDESHKIKELGTRRSPVKVTDFVLDLGPKTPYKIILTATPTQKEYGGYVDYHTQLQFLGYLSISRTEFMKRYCYTQKMAIPGSPYPITKIIGYKNTAELDSLLATVSRRYVPKFTDDEPRNIVEYLEKPKSYNSLAKQRYYNDLNLTNLTAMRIAKKTLTSGIVIGYNEFKEPRSYVDNTIKRGWVKEFLQDTDEVVVIFYKYNIELAQLESVCQELGLPYIVLNGANKRKKEDIDAGNYRVVLGQYNASGESIDGLQNYSHIAVYYAMPESSLEYTQSLGRINRIGQEKLPIYYHLVMSGTIDEQIYDMTLRKVEFNESVLDKLTITDERSDENVGR